MRVYSSPRAALPRYAADRTSSGAELGTTTTPDFGDRGIATTLSQAASSSGSVWITGRTSGSITRTTRTA